MHAIHAFKQWLFHFSTIFIHNFIIPDISCYNHPMNSSKKGHIIIPASVTPWPHELRVAKILAMAGFAVEFLPPARIKTADIKLNGVEFEIKSPITQNPKKIIRNIKRALQQSPNVILDASRIKGMRDDTLRKLLASRAKGQKTLKKLLLITKRGQIIDILSLI